MTYSELVDKIHADTTGIAKGYDISFLQELFVCTIKTSEDFDKLMARDLKMFSEIEQSLLNANEPKEGEFVEFDGNLARICSTRYDDKFQLSNKIGVYVSDGNSQASGCTWDCDIEIKNEGERLKLPNLKPTGRTMKGRCWTFSDRDAGSGRGVWFEIEFKVWSLGGLA